MGRNSWQALLRAAQAQTVNKTVDRTRLRSPVLKSTSQPHDQGNRFDHFDWGK